ncbi:MAG: hypothetical protein R3192_11865 [Woeseiaceae bacterium]|nr:hypothetical protein [Woeseiaceae bacterium]
MTEEQNSRATPSRANLLKGALLALVAAVVVTVIFVMPAEYGVDPTGAGARLGLLDLAASAEALEGSTTEGSSVTVIGTWPGIPDEFDFYDPPVLGDPYSRTQPSKFRSDTLTISLDVGEQTEYKAIMKQGDALVYHWRLNNGTTVYTDFHADPGEDAAGYPDQYYIRYAESETAESSGSIVAPFDGNHGWYWLNIEEEPITITLEVHGFYASIDELMRSYQY